MKSNKNRLYWYIILVIVTCIVGLFSYQGVIAEGSQEITDEPPERTCDFEINNFVRSITCRGIKATTSYSINPINSEGKDDNGYFNNIYGYCYYDPRNNGYFYEIMQKKWTFDEFTRQQSWDESTIAKEFINVNNSENIYENLDIRINVKDGESLNGCARHVYGYFDTNIYGNINVNYYLFSYEELTTEEVKSILVKDDVVIGTVGLDDQTVQNVASCIETGLTNGENCDDSDYTNIVNDCMNTSKVGYLYTNNQNLADSIKEIYQNEKELKRIATKRAKVCTYVTKCHANAEDTLSFLNEYKEGYNLNAARKLIENYFPKSARSCIEQYLDYDFSADAAEGASKLAEAISESLDAAALQLTKDGEETFGEYGQQYYTYPDKPKAKSYHIVPGDDCNAILSEETTKLFNSVLRYMQYLGPVLVVVLSTMDFIKAAASGNPDDMKKAWNKLVKRLIAAILLFFVSLITRLLLSFFDITVPENCLK